jgi:aspartokinase
MKETEVTETDSSGGGFGFDFEAALPYFVMAAKAQEGGGPKGTTDALIAFGKMKGDQESAKYKKSMAEYQKALAEYTKEKATIDYAKLSAKQLNEEFNREAEIAKILTDQLNDPLSAAGKSREILKAELIRSKQRMRKIQSAITGQPQSKATVKRDTK